MSRTISWKIFQLQSALLGDEVSPETVKECTEWFQPKQFYEVVVERNVSHRCGLPTCGNAIKYQNRSAKESVNPKVSEEDVSQDMERSEFCSKKCYASAVDYTNGLSVLPAASRPRVQQLLTEVTPPTISEFLEVLGGISLEEEKKPEAAAQDGATLAGKRQAASSTSCKSPPAEVPPKNIVKPNLPVPPSRKPFDGPSTASAGAASAVPDVSPAVVVTSASSSSPSSSASSVVSDTTPRTPDPAARPRSGSNSSTGSSSAGKYKKKSMLTVLASAPPTLSESEATFDLRPPAPQGASVGNMSTNRSASLPIETPEGATLGTDAVNRARLQKLQDEQRQLLQKQMQRQHPKVPVDDKEHAYMSKQVRENVAVDHKSVSTDVGAKPSVSNEDSATSTKRSGSSSDGAAAQDAPKTQKVTFSAGDAAPMPLTSATDAKDASKPPSEGATAASEPAPVIPKRPILRGKAAAIAAAAAKEKSSATTPATAPAGKAAAGTTNSTSGNAPAASNYSDDTNSEARPQKAKQLSDAEVARNFKMSKPSGGAMMTMDWFSKSKYPTRYDDGDGDGDGDNESNDGDLTDGDPDGGGGVSAADRAIWREIFGKEYSSETESEDESENVGGRSGMAGRSGAKNMVVGDNNLRRPAVYADVTSSEEEEEEEDESDDEDEEVGVSGASGSEEGSEVVTLTVLKAVDDVTPVAEALKKATIDRTSAVLPAPAGSIRDTRTQSGADSSASSPPRKATTSTKSAASSATAASSKAVVTAPPAPQSGMPLPVKGRSGSNSREVGAAGAPSKGNARPRKNVEPEIRNTFTTIWCLIDDLLGHNMSVLKSVVEFDKQSAQSANSAAATATAATDASSIVMKDAEDGEYVLCGVDGLAAVTAAAQIDESTAKPPRRVVPPEEVERNRIFKGLVERGVSVAEKMLDVMGDDNALDPKQRIVYSRKKSYLLGALFVFNSGGTAAEYGVSLTATMSRQFMKFTSIEWTMVGVMLVDMLFRSLGLVSNVTSSTDAETRRSDAAITRDVKGDAPHLPVIATSANVDELWSNKVAHSMHRLVERHNTRVAAKSSGTAAASKPPQPAHAGKGNSSADNAAGHADAPYRAFTDGEILLLRCFFNGSS